jgi:hypothetical protein
MSTALPGGSTGTATAKPVRPNVTRVALIAIVLIIAFSLIRSFVSHHETGYERIARELTLALQANDLATVDKLQNSETRGHVTRAAVGHAADVFAPLGDLKTTRETTANGETHEFDATFDKGVVHETIQFDPDSKIVHFRFDPPTPK